MDSAELRKWEFLRDAPQRDAQSLAVQSVARSLLSIAALSPWRDWAFAQLALAVARDLSVYVTDTDRVGRQQIDGFNDPQGSPLDLIERGTGECHNKARLFIALCLAVGIPAEMVPKWTSYLQHVSARVYIAGPWSNGKKSWWPVETILSRAILGDHAEQVPVEKDTGRWQHTGTRRVA